MLELTKLHADHAAVVLAFEQVNRAWFASSISDRGDDYFEQFPVHFDAVLAEQEAGVLAFYLLLDNDGSVVGRFNLYDLDDRQADLGYRVAQHSTGRGVATAAVLQLCRLAVVHHGLHTLRAATSDQNTASRRVLTKAGFLPVGPADPSEVGGKPGTWFHLDLKPVVTRG
ncbi:GNAT family N-acetyltransferase [Actinoplanes bogorensis]|uniref:GNAT family N-acetyltransferase n=1 Tax=Paractinoplanes bogorensis TaxID=1610840 RepID=A0ABS5Z3R7_9ACTN|nr:GNAT family N-acetyltransferase [Actinoplanes bogorensis]MBU2670292.1 GNAT family N-acetyltransferase [Actinoplanes bogorensis]